MTTRPTCAARACTNTRRRGHLMCHRCWNQVPAHIQREVYAAYKPAAGIRQNAAWLAAAQRAIESLQPTEA